MCVCVCVLNMLVSLQVFSVAVVCVLCSGQRVFSRCGARLDVVDVQGLVLSPGFPDNYSSNTHCVWQFFVPVGHRLKMEMFDFDVFESSERNLTTSAEIIGSEDGEKHLGTEGLILSRSGLKEQSVEVIRNGDEENRMESDMLDTEQCVSFPEDKLNPMPPSSPTSVMEEESDPLQLMTDACPDDVLYITDLITFSSRFCGSKHPSDDQLVFGSDVEVVEVIMELITNTHWGRGFALIFRYHNRTTDGAVEVGGQRSSAPSAGAVEALLAAVSLAALFTTSLMIVLCVTQRFWRYRMFCPVEKCLSEEQSKLCPKESTVTSSISCEVPVQNSHTDGSELQLVTANYSQQELDKNDNHHTSPHTGKIPKCRSSQNADLECSNGLMEMEVGPDDVFVISSTDTLSFSPCMHRERFLRHSDTGSLQPCDRMPRSEPVNWPSRGSHVASPRPRAWSVRTFQDFLLPLPQLNRKWCSWNLTSPFTKLMDTVSPGSVVDGADGVTVTSSQHRYNTSRSHTSQLICEPDGALCSPEPEEDVTIREFAAAAAAADDDENLTIPVFAISEEDDREPLVSAEHQYQVKNNEIGNHQSFTSLGSAHSAFTAEESENASSEIGRPSLSHVTVPCDSLGKHTYPHVSVLHTV